MRDKHCFTCKNGLHVQTVTLTEIAAPPVDTHSPRVITFIGGGGKTSLMILWSLALHEKGFSVVACTTTKMSAEVRPGVSFFHPAGLDDARTLLQNRIQSGEIITLAGGLLPAEGKVSGIPAGWVDQLSREFPATIFLVEGDGSAGRSLKGHLPHEPVIPACTSLLIPILGLDVLGKPMNAGNVHRPMVFGEIAGVKPEAPIGANEIVAALFNSGGYLRQAPKTATVIPLLNKLETRHLWKAGLRIARQILAEGHPQIKSVLAGSVHQNCFVRVS